MKLIVEKWRKFRENAMIEQKSTLYKGMAMDTDEEGVITFRPYGGKDASTLTQKQKDAWLKSQDIQHAVPDVGIDKDRPYDPRWNWSIQDFKGWMEENTEEIDLLFDEAAQLSTGMLRHSPHQTNDMEKDLENMAAQFGASKHAGHAEDALQSVRDYVNRQKRIERAIADLEGRGKVLSDDQKWAAKIKYRWNFQGY